LAKNSFDLKKLIQEVKAMGAGGELLGLDVGQGSVKICQISGTAAKPKISRFCILPFPESSFVSGEVQLRDEVIATIQEALSKGGFSARKVVMGIKGALTTSRRLTVPEGTKDEIEDHVMWESEQYVPFDIDDAIISHSLIAKKDEGTVDIMMAAASIEAVEARQLLMTDAGLKPFCVDLEVFALSNALEAIVGPKKLEVISKEGAVIIDIGAQTTKVVVFRNLAPMFTKEIEWGGELITEEIQSQMSLNFEEAEALKKSEENGDPLPEEVTIITNNCLDKLLAELKTTLNFFLTASVEERIAHCFITGGSSLLPALKDVLAEILEMEVQYLNPLDHLDFDKKNFTSSLIRDFNSCGAVSLGLAIRGKLR